MSIPDRVAVLFANDAFYAAFANRDFEAMERLWSKHHPVTCIHPGWNALSGRKAVMQSWQAILANPAAPQISCHRPSAYLFAGFAYVLCYESLDSGFLIATNVFVHEDASWRLLHHQAAASPPPPIEEEAPPVQ